MDRRIVIVLVGGALMALGCGESGPGPLDAGGGVDAPIAAEDSGQPGDSGPPATHDCTEADFVDRTTGTDDSRMIMVPRGTSTFDLPCMTIRAGQSVQFMWDFSAHPLAPGVAPGHPGTSTEPSPIAPQTTGVLYTVAFPSEGSYAYYCTSHYHSGMYGVVRVVP